MVTQKICKGKSAGSAKLCSFIPKKAGEYRITASTKDTKNRNHTTTIQAWVIGKNYVVWEGQDSHHLKILPEKEKYKVGDKARYLIKSPFQKGKALITLERQGVIKKWVQNFNTSTPIVEFKITEFDPRLFLIHYCHIPSSFKI